LGRNGGNSGKEGHVRNGKLNKGKDVVTPVWNPLRRRNADVPRRDSGTSSFLEKTQKRTREERGGSGSAYQSPGKEGENTRTFTGGVSHPWGYHKKGIRKRSMDSKKKKTSVPGQLYSGRHRSQLQIRSGKESKAKETHGHGCSFLDLPKKRRQQNNKSQSNRVGDMRPMVGSKWKGEKRTPLTTQKEKRFDTLGGKKGCRVPGKSMRAMEVGGNPRSEVWAGWQGETLRTTRNRKKKEGPRKGREADGQPSCGQRQPKIEGEGIQEHIGFA